jgi:prepilin-type processing-associated H-X9-DG protein
MSKESPADVERLEFQRPQAHSPRRIQFKILFICIGGGFLLLAALVIMWYAAEVSNGRIIVNRITCASNLRQIGQAVFQYANVHGGELPDSFQTLSLNSSLPPKTFVCPSSRDKAASGITAEEVALNLTLPGHLSYIYLGGGLTNQMVTPETILAYEPVGNHAGETRFDGCNVLFGDGHSEWLPASAIQAIESKVKARRLSVTYP